MKAAHARVPEWFPSWAGELSELYYSGSTSLFVLHGNVHDLCPLSPPTDRSTEAFLIS